MENEGTEEEVAAKTRLEEAMVSDFIGQALTKEAGHALYKIILGNINRQGESLKAYDQYQKKEKLRVLATSSAKVSAVPRDKVVLKKN